MGDNNVFHVKQQLLRKKMSLRGLELNPSVFHQNRECIGCRNGEEKSGSRHLSVTMAQEQELAVALIKRPRKHRRFAGEASRLEEGT